MWYSSSLSRLVLAATILQRFAITLCSAKFESRGIGLHPNDVRQFQFQFHVDQELLSEQELQAKSSVGLVLSLRGGVNLIPAGYNPLGYRITELGLKFLEFDGSLDCDVGRFLAGMKTGTRKSFATIKEQWLEIVRVSKQGQSMRVYRTLEELIDFCLKAGFLN